MTSENLPRLVRICRFVEGLPLAIEMAATWVTHLAPAEIAANLEADLSLLQLAARDLPPRQHSIAATLDYSWTFLTTEEAQQALDLPLFVGIVSRHALQAILGLELPTLQSLVDKSILSAIDAGRYQLHSVIRTFIVQKRAALSAEERMGQVETKRRYCQYYLTLLVDQASRLNRADAGEALSLLRGSLPNIRQAWHEAFTIAPELIQEKTIDALIAFYMRIGFSDDAIACCQSILDHSTVDATDDALSLTDQRTSRRSALEPNLAATAEVNLAEIYLKLACYPDALQHARRAIDLATSDQYPHGIGRGSCALGCALIFSWKHQEADTCLREALQIAIDHNSLMLQGRCHENLAYLLSEREAYQQGSLHSQRAYVCYADEEDLPGMAAATAQNAGIAMNQGKVDEAIDSLIQARDHQQ
ncbi:hypothetical protein KFU94_56485 [Chloroflexi bacterium TSY]|nr:hypothetical protein [Chloroflexi bacterium TSY]